MLSNKQKKLNIFILLTAVAVAVLSWPVAADAGWVTTQLTDNSYMDYHPQISDSNVVWEGRNDGDDEIFLYDGTSTIQLTNNTYSDYNPQIDANGHVVWEGYDGSDYEIFLYNGTSTIQLTNNTYGDYNHQINANGHVVWEGRDGSDDEIFLYDGTSTIKLTNNTYGDDNPQINANGHVVWEGYDGSDYEIFLYDGTSTTQLTNNTYGDGSPQISDNGHVVWQGDGSDSEIFLYDGTSTIQLTNNTYGDGMPQISNNGDVVWLGDIRVDSTDGYPVSYASILLYDSSNGSTTQLYEYSYPTDDPSDIVSLYYDINASGHVVWWGPYPYGENSEIFLYDGTSTIQLTNNTYYDGSPQISDNGYVVWYGWDGSDYEIYLASMTAEPDELLMDMAQDVIGLNLQQGISNSLDAKLGAALQAIDDINTNNDVAAINTLQAFINAVEAQRGNKIPEADADALIATAQEIIDLLSAE